MQPYGNILARDIMETDLIVAGPDQTLAELERLLTDSKISGVPVIDNGQLVGVVSRSDVVRAPVLMEVFDRIVTDADKRLDSQSDAFQHRQQEPHSGFRDRMSRLTIRNIMRKQVVTCSPDTPLAKVADEMLRHHIHRIIVCQDQRPVGVVSSLDIVKVLRDALSDDGAPVQN